MMMTRKNGEVNTNSKISIADEREVVKEQNRQRKLNATQPGLTFIGKLTSTGFILARPIAYSHTGAPKTTVGKKMITLNDEIYVKKIIL